MYADYDTYEEYKIINDATLRSEMLLARADDPWLAAMRRVWRLRFECACMRHHEYWIRLDGHTLQHCVHAPQAARVTSHQWLIAEKVARNSRPPALDMCIPLST